MKRYYEEYHPYFVTTVTHERQSIFLNEKLCDILLVSLEYFKLLLDYKIYAYCIMPDHLHLIIHPIGKNNISYIMQMIKGSFSRKINKMNLSSGRIWQKRFYDTIIRNEGMLLDKMEYIHTNPLRKGLVISPEQYEYSSYRFYTENRKNILDLDRLIL